MLTRTVKIINPSGLHMRPAGLFVKSVQGFQSEVKFRIRNGEYNAKSMLNILSAAVKCGDEIELEIEGSDEQECMNAIVAAVESGLGE